MTTFYIATFPLPQPAAASWDTVTGIVDGWCADRIGVRPDPAGTAATPDGSGRVDLADLGGPGRRVTRWDAYKRDDSWAFGVTTWLVEDTDTAYVRVRLSIETTTDQVTDLHRPIRAPGFVRDLVDALDVHVDGLALGTAQTVSSTDVPGLVALLTDPNRRLPVVVLTPRSTTGRPAVEAAPLTRRLVGIAHVAKLAATTTTFSLTDRLGGPRLSVFKGAARIYWPRFALDDPGARHPIWAEQRLSELGQSKFETLLFDRIGRTAGLTGGVPRLERTLRSERTVATDQQRRDEVAEARRQLENNRTDSTADARWAEFEKLFDTELAARATEIGELRAERDRLADDVESLTADLEAVRANFVAATATTTAVEALTPTVPAEDVVPRTVLEAVQLAELQCPNLTFLKEVLTSAKASHYPDPQQVLTDLVALDQVADAWRRNVLPQGIKVACKESGLKYRQGISQTAETAYRDDYRRTYRSEQVMLRPHVRRGVGPPTTILGIYWHQDPIDHTFVIGHVGAKLRDEGNH